MDPEAVKRLISDLEEICREHQEKLQKRIAQEGEREPSPSSPSSPSSLFVLPSGSPQPPRIWPKLAPLKPHDWAKILGEVKGSNEDKAPAPASPSPNSEARSPAARWLRQGEPAEAKLLLPHVPANMLEPEGLPKATPAATASATDAPVAAEEAPVAKETPAAKEAPADDATADEPTSSDGEGDSGRARPLAHRRKQKSASLNAAAIRAVAMKNVHIAEEAPAEMEAESVPVIITPRPRQSMASNFSDAAHRSSVITDTVIAEPEIWESEQDPGQNQKRRGEVKKQLGCLPPSLIAQAEDFGSKKRMRKSQLLAEESRKRVAENQTLPQKIISSGWYESLSGGLILLNCGFVAWQTQSKALEDESNVENSIELSIKEPVLFNVIQGVFAIVFAIDLGVRIWADKMCFLSCRNREILWNVLDSLVVAFDLFSLFLEVWVQFGLLRMMRVIRIVRVIKIIRVMKSFAELRMLMYSIISCIKSLVWVIAVLALMLGLFAVLFTSATGSELDSLEKRRDPRNALLVKTFGTLDRSVVELYMAMTGGTDWVVQYEAVFSLPVIYHGMFLIYITFSIYALANVITSIFLENARRSSKTDREHVIQEELQSRTQYMRDIEMIFAEMDVDGNGLISRQEFEDTMGDERVVAYFRSMKLDAREAEQVFNLLDYDDSGEVSYEEFVDGCWKLQGEARSLDMKMVQLEVAALSRAVRGVQQSMDQSHGKMRRSHVETPEELP